MPSERAADSETEALYTIINNNQQPPALQSPLRAGPSESGRDETHILYDTIPVVSSEAGLPTAQQSSHIPYDAIPDPIVSSETGLPTAEQSNHILYGTIPDPIVSSETGLPTEKSSESTYSTLDHTLQTKLAEGKAGDNTPSFCETSNQILQLQGVEGVSSTYNTLDHCLKMKRTARSKNHTSQTSNQTSGRQMEITRRGDNDGTLEGGKRNGHLTADGVVVKPPTHLDSVLYSTLDEVPEKGFSDENQSKNVAALYSTVDKSRNMAGYQLITADAIGNGAPCSRLDEASCNADTRRLTKQGLSGEDERASALYSTVDKTRSKVAKGLMEEAKKPSEEGEEEGASALYSTVDKTRNMQNYHMITAESLKEADRNDTEKPDSTSHQPNSQSATDQ